MLQARYIITHGLPGSGKSTWAEEEVQRLRTQGILAVRVNRDDIRTVLFGNDYHTEKPDQKKEHQVSEIQDKLIHEHLSKNYTVINDDTNLNQRFMGHHLVLARDYGIKLEQKYFDVDIQVCKDRNKARAEAGGRYVPEHEIDKMAKSAYGKNGRLKKFFIGENTSFGYDTTGTEDEKMLAEFKKEQSILYPENNKLVVSFDLDGTLVDVREIADKYMSDPKKRNYHSFHMASKDSPAIQSVLEDAIRARKEGYTVYAITARSDSYARVSMEWLKNNGVPVSRLYMRKNGDYRKDYEVKTDIINEIREEGKEIVLAYEDNPTARAAYQDSGIRVIEVPFYKSTPIQSSDGADQKNSESTDVDTVVSLQPRDYPEVKISSAFGSGQCIRCGSKLKDKNKTIGDRCKQIQSN